jgi:hypothetical protein
LNWYIHDCVIYIYIWAVLTIKVYIKFWIFALFYLWRRIKIDCVCVLKEKFG